MKRTKIDYGIDLGTTNSAISRMENGEPSIKKTDMLKDTMPSCVFVNKKQAIQVGDSAYNSLKRDKLKSQGSQKASNAFIEFKRTMGSDKRYPCPSLGKDLSSEELSAEILKGLKSFIDDESVSSAVITVPAKFTTNQKDATVRAAELAGLQHCELLQEPVAASLAYGLSADTKSGHWLVFDFGGGTFDAAIVKAEEGIMKVIDTEGDNYLGGRDLDYAIVDHIIIPYLEAEYELESYLSDEQNKSKLRDAMKFYAEETKIQMSFKDSYELISDVGDIPLEDEDGEELELDITISKNNFKKAVGPIFQKAIDISKELLQRNNLSGSSIQSLILVGGPTYSPVLREMLTEQIAKPDTSVDPMTVVSRGAALFASTVELSETIQEQTRDRAKVQLELGHEATSVETEEWVTVKLRSDKMDGEAPNELYVTLTRADGGWASGKTLIDETGDLIEVVLEERKTNAFNVSAYNEQGDLLESEPSQISIIQGAKIGSAPLPYGIGVAVLSPESKRVEYRSIQGLEKNQSTPAVGTANGLKTQKDIRPGEKGDFIKIGLYEGEHDAEGTRAILNELIYDAIITGADLPKFLPEGSDVDLTVKVASEKIKLSVYFPSLDFTTEIDAPTGTTQKDIDNNWLQSEIDRASEALALLDESSTDSHESTEIAKQVQDAQDKFDHNPNDYDTKKSTLENLRGTLKRIDKLNAASEWPEAESELKEVFYKLEELSNEFDSEIGKKMLNEYRPQVQEVIKAQDLKSARELIEAIRSVNFAIVDEGLGAQMEVMYLNNFREEFDILDWSDPSRARMLLNQGLQMAADGASKQELRPIVMELYRLLPSADKPMLGGDGSELIG